MIVTPLIITTVVLAEATASALPVLELATIGAIVISALTIVGAPFGAVISGAALAGAIGVSAMLAVLGSVPTRTKGAALPHFAPIASPESSAREALAIAIEVATFTLSIGGVARINHTAVIRRGCLNSR